MWEWVFDGHGSLFPTDDPCVDCVHVMPESARGIRGGSSQQGALELEATYRQSDDPPDTSWPNLGMRCARAP